MMLDGKTALITGAGRGIGRAIALKFASEGATVFLSGRSEDILLNTRKEIEALGRDAFIVPGDIRDEKIVTSILDQMLAIGGKVDILVNNAGISKEMKLSEMPMEVWDEIIQTNLRSVVLCIKAALPHMIANGGGNIINIASAAGLRGLPGSAAYSASKAAVICLSQALGDELRPHRIRVNAICPGPVDTELFKQSERRSFIMQAGGDLFQPEDVANAALYLASSMSSGISSQILTVRGLNRW